MRSPRIWTAIALASIAIPLAGCVSSERPPAPGRITLPAAPGDVAECLRRAFPEIPDRALTKADLVRIVGAAKVLDRAKIACGLRAVSWIEAVRAEFAL